jgi:TRAP-type uncharacterized transport system fused permease subunit
MATKKQRRRRQKERRHDYEFVYVDPEGEEVEVDEPEPKPREERKPTSGIKPTAATKAKSGAGRSARSERVVEPPSWERTLRRAAIFVPIMLIFLYLTRPANASTGAIVLQAVFIIVLLIAFMYGMDTFLYRSYQKRQAKKAGGGSPPKTK